MKYFAYGSNMVSEAMAEVCETYSVIGSARLDDHRLSFTRRSIKTNTGVADIVPSPGLYTWGVLFEIDVSCLSRLDRKEGRGTAYNHREDLSSISSALS